MNGFARARVALADLQARLGKPPKRKEIPVMVEKIILESGIKGTERKQYFRLLATCALKNQEQRFRNWKPIRRKK